jgi:catechol 2,3-dioxygenase-like lactoylglutathione lyase family enzyme
MIETQGLTHINLLVADIRRAKQFYEKVFGFQEMFWAGPALMFLKPPGTSDTITLQEKPEGAGVTGNIDHFGLRLTDRSQLDRAIEEVVEAGGSLVERGEHEPGRPFAYVADPDGHIIEF